MKIVQSVIGKFHHFHLARQLHSRGCLEKIFSSYPTWKLKNEGVPIQKISTFPWLHTALFAKWKFLGKQAWLDRELCWQVSLTLDQYAFQNLPECDVFIGISSAGLQAGKLAQARGGKYICDRGSSHIRYADQLLTEEFQHWGQKFDGIDPRIIEREEAEYETADTITVPSEFARRSFIQMGVPATKIYKIPYGADLFRFQPIKSPPTDAFNILFVGNVSFRKGVPYLLKAFQTLQHPAKKLRIVGAIAPEMKTFLKTQQHLENVEFLGTYPHLQLKEIMSKSHVMVLPSVEEGLALVQGEAMACGCPLISSQNTGAEDLFTDGQEGFIIPPRNVNALVERLEQLAQDPDLRLSMSQAALRRVKSIGGWNAYGEKFVKLLNESTEK